MWLSSAHINLQIEFRVIPGRPEQSCTSLPVEVLNNEYIVFHSPDVSKASMVVSCIHIAS